MNITNARTRPVSLSHFVRGHPKWRVPFYSIEWACEWTVFIARQWAFIEILEIAAKFTIAYSLFFYATSRGERTRAAEDQRTTKQYAAWQMLASARGQKSDFGRVRAIGHLNSEKIPLTGLDLSEANLSNLIITNDDIDDSVFVNAKLRQPRFERLTLNQANFDEAFLFQGNFRDFDAEFGTTQTVMFESCITSNSKLWFGGFSTGLFYNCDFENVWFYGVENCCFYNCNLVGVQFDGLTNIPHTMKDCNIYNPQFSTSQWKYARDNIVRSTFTSPTEWRTANKRKFEKPTLRTK